MLKNIIFYSSLLISLSSFGVKESLSQPVSKEEIRPQIRFGNITFLPREIESSSSSLRLLEIQIEIFNRSQNVTAPPNSIRVVVAQKEVKYSSPKVSEEFSPPPEEATFSSPLPPGFGRVLIIGFPIPKEKVDSITFEIQINPPEGEKKIVTWRES